MMTCMSSSGPGTGGRDDLGARLLAGHPRGEEWRQLDVTVANLTLDQLVGMGGLVGHSEVAVADRVADRDLVRRLEKVVVDRLALSPVVVLHGARTVGKSTLLRRLATRLDGHVVDLDERSARAIAAADPSLYTSADRLALIDEYQRVPELLDAIKAELNRALRPGRFVVTGSTNYSTIPRASQSLTGRAEVLTVWPFTQGEVDSRHETFTETLLADPARFRGASAQTSRAGYAQRVLGGGMPVALRQLSELARRRLVPGIPRPRGAARCPGPLHPSPARRCEPGSPNEGSKFRCHAGVSFHVPSTRTSAAPRPTR